MKQVNISAGLRAEFGKGAAKRLRRSGLIPVILYGRKAEPIALNLDPLDLKKAAGSGTKENVLINLSIEGGEETQNRIIMLKELQTHPVTENYLHADFYEIVMDEKIVMPVSIRLIGKAKGVEVGGILRQVKREVEVRALPSEIPSHIEVDVSNLDIGHAIHLNEIELDEKVEVLDHLDLTIVTVLAPTVAKEEEEIEEGEEEEEKEKEMSVEEGKEG